MKDKIIHIFSGGIMNNTINWIVTLHSQIIMILSSIYSNCQTTNSKLAYTLIGFISNEINGKIELAEFAIYTREVVSTKTIRNKIIRYNALDD
jgi:hypothetical protein